MAKFYVTTSIPYVNGDPHIGFAMELLQADVLARYHRQKGDDTLFVTGTDEHGGKVAQKAEELGKTPQEFSDEISQKFRDLATLLNVSNDRFIRTTDRGHVQRAQLVWKNLSQHIYKDKYVGMYCTGCEAFVTEAVAKENNNICPNHNKPYERIEEENYFFKLSNFAEQIKTAIETDELQIVPATRKQEILQVINSGLEDISISRPKEKIAWGIPVTDDDSQVMYVWFEALMNYITVLGYPEHKDFTTYWPASVQVIGKDILRFHAAIWPGMLLALGVALPKSIFVHGFINVEGKKMSKSLGNVTAPQDIVQEYGVDAFRYYFLRHISAYEDGDYSAERMLAAYNNELGNELGNAVQRTAAMLTKYQNGLIGTVPPAEHDAAQYHEAIAACRFDKALGEVWEQVRGLNQYIDETKPWALAKNSDEEHLKEVLAYQVSCLLEIAELLEPFLPETATKIEALFAKGVVQPSGGTLFPRKLSE